MVLAIVVIVAVVVVGSIAEISAQSAPERQAIDRSYVTLAIKVVDASNQTGVALAKLLASAPTLPNRSLPFTARSQIQQGLDGAVAASDGESSGAASLAPPEPSGGLAPRVAAVFALRAAAVNAIRSAIDGVLGMAPLPIAGAPASSASASTSAPSAPSTAPSLSTAQASGRLASAGSVLQRADRSYAALASDLKRGKVAGAGSITMPASVWVTGSTSPLSPSQLGALPAALAASAALVPFHHLVVTAVGLSPAALPSTTPNDPAGSGLIGVSCGSPASTVPGATPTVLPPTGTVSALVTVTNCGTVTETGITVSETLALADPPGTSAPPSGARGASAHQVVSLLSGSSRALVMPALTVAGGHEYTLTVSLVLSGSQAAQQSPVGTTQEFLLRVS